MQRRGSWGAQVLCRDWQQPVPQWEPNACQEKAQEKWDADPRPVKIIIDLRKKIVLKFNIGSTYFTQLNFLNKKDKDPDP